ncbi:MAG: amino acid adenylation domain-containing protein [Legionellaceae bacterium]|nr:amino acid adenylation domain-containing protein [Legionellaceae bacterium]
MMTINDFFNAIQQNNMEGVIAGFRAGFNADSTNEHGESALDIALKAGFNAIIAFLMEPPELAQVPKTGVGGTSQAEDKAEPIAIVGMSCRFAGDANNIDGLWHSLLAQTDSITTAPSGRYVTRQDYTDAQAFPAAFLKDDLGLFDAGFFRINQDEAALMDPQQRMLLEQTYHAFEQGGFDMHALSGKQVGVYVGQMTHDYSDMMRADSDEGNPRFATGNIDSVLSGRIAYLFNFLGEALTLNTACSSSLACMHIASNSLRQGHVDMAMVAGVNAIIDPRLMKTAASAGMTSPDGTCKAFSHDANGYGRGEGVGVVLLKRLSDAIHEGDNILALIRGSALNQDGHSSQLTAPMKSQQVAVIQQALKVSGLTADDIDVVEAHGTGTILGDRIESEALSQVFGQRPEQSRVMVRTVKSNIGHTEAAAGVAAVMKTVLSLKYGQVPGQARLTQLNPKLDLRALNIDVHVKPWPYQSGKLRRAGVSSYGFSGTNAHLIIEEAPSEVSAVERLRCQWQDMSGFPVPEQPGTLNEKQLLVLSAKSKDALANLVHAYKKQLSEAEWSLEQLANLAYTAAVGRTHQRERRGVIFSSQAELLEKLEKEGFESKTSSFSLEDPTSNQLDAMKRWYHHDAYLQSIVQCYLTKEEVGRLQASQKDWSTTEKSLHAFILMYAAAIRYQNAGLSTENVPAQGVGKQIQAVITNKKSIDSVLNQLRKAKLGVTEGKEKASNIANGYDFFLQSLAAHYQASKTIDWRQVWKGYVCKKIDLPLYPFQRQRYWYDSVLTIRPRTSSAVNGLTLNPVHLSGGALIYEHRFDIGEASLQFLAEHRVGEQIIFPGAGYIDLILRAVKPLQLKGCINIEKIQFQQPLILREDSVTSCQIRLTPSTDGKTGYEVEIHAWSGQETIDKAVCHVRANIGFETLAAQKAEYIDDFKDSAQSVLTGRDIYDRLATLALSYGEGWQLVTHGYIKNRQVLVELAERSESERTTRIDAALHATIALIDSSEMPKGTGLVPKMLENLTIYGDVCRTKYVMIDKKGTDNSFGFSLQFYDEQGNRLANIERYSAAKTKLAHVEINVLADSSFKVDWQRHELSYVLDAQSHFKAGADFTQLNIALPQASELPKKDDVWLSQYGRIVFSMILVQRWPSLQTVGATVNLNQVEAGKQPEGHFSVLLRKGFHYLAAANFVSLDGDIATVIKPVASSTDLIRQLDTMYADEHDIQQVFLKSVTRDIDAIIEGRLNPLHVLFPKDAGAESYRHAAAVYQNAKDARMANIITSKVVEALQSSAGDKRIRILEIGAGTGGTTRALVPKLSKFANVSYVYTDVSPGFAKNCDECFSRTDINYRFALLDISQNPVEQGFASGQFDIIIATNVLHATTNIVETLTHVQRLLVRGGVSIISETIEDAAWLDLTFGLTSAWWVFNDEVRTNSPLMNKSQWEQVLLDVGMPCQYSQGDSQRVFLACSSEGPRLSKPITTTPPTNFVISFDESVRPLLERPLQEQGITAVDWSDMRQIDRTIALIKACYKPRVYFITPFSKEKRFDMAVYQEQVGKPLLKLLQALHGRAASINLITRSVKMGTKKNQRSPEQETFTGFVTSAAQENSLWHAKAIDCHHDLLLRPDLASRVVSVSVQETKDVEFVISGDDFLVPRMISAPELVDTPQQFGREGVVLITGGTGEIGQALVRHLAGLGHRKFALLSRRSGAPLSLDKNLDVRVYIDDLSDLEKLDTTWRSVSETQGPIESVFHLAGTLSDKSLKDMTWADVELVFKSKVVGAYHLHMVSSKQPLSRFVLFSSIASLLSTPGQMNHVAANRFMDALAHMRRDMGLPAISINWGFWSEIGSAARIEADVKGKRNGYLALTPAQCFQALDQVLSANPAQVVIARFDWKAYFKKFFKQTVPPLFSRIANDFASALKVTSPSSPSAWNWDDFVSHHPGKKEQVQTLANKVLSLLRIQLRIDDSVDISTDAPLNAFPVEIDSYSEKEVVDALNDEFGWQDMSALTTNVFFSHQTIDQMAETMWQQLVPNQLIKTSDKAINVETVQAGTASKDCGVEGYADDAVAIIGMSLRFPGANNAGQYWQVLNTGYDPMEEKNSGRQGENCYFGHAEGRKAKTAKAGFLSTDISQFDAGFFNIKDEEAAVMDPQQRLLLQLVWEALENAGIAPSTLKDTNTSVVIGMAANEFGDLLLHHSEEDELSKFHASGNNPSATVGRISYQLGLRGANLAVNTACSSSLVSLHTACHQIKEGSADIAITGAVNLILSPGQMKLYQSNGMLSPTHHCHTFSDQADGMVRAEGCAVYILKSLKKAYRDGDNILAVVEGTTVNQNGASFSFMSPNLDAQRALIRASLSSAKIVPEQLDWVETHGTGTKLGDPVEVEALAQEFALPGKQLPLGAVKSNIGHAEAAAGAAGLSKIIISMQQQSIPANRFDGKLNPSLRKFLSRLAPLSKPVPWQGKEGHIRRALLSSFGFSGTNAQAVVAEPPRAPAVAALRLANQWQVFQAKNPVWGKVSYPNDLESADARLFVVSSKTEEGLRAQLAQLVDWLENHSRTDDEAFLERVAMTLSQGRDHFAYRSAIQAANIDDLVERLGKVLEKPCLDKSNPYPKKLAFLFTGQGSQYVGMGQELYLKHPLYRAIFDHCATILNDYLEDDLTDIIFGENASTLVKKTSYTQPALFVLEYALAQVVMAYGMQPDYVLGHSVGEYVAATLAGCMSLEDGLKLICARGRIMEKAPDGKMVAVFCDADTAKSILDENKITLDIAAKNYNKQTILSGIADEATKAIAVFKARHIRAHALDVQKAFHSSCMEPVLDEFRKTALEVAYHKPNALTFISSLTGKQVTSTLDAEHWVGHLRQGVDFIGAITTLDQLGVEQCCELGPKAVLVTMAKTILEARVSQIAWYDALLPKKSDLEQLHGMIAKFYQLGGTVNWQAMWVCSLVKPIELPTYAFQTQSYWPVVLGGQKPEAVKQTSVVLQPNKAQEVWNAAQETIVDCLNVALPNKSISGLDATFHEYGGSSLELPTFQESIYRATGVTLSMKELEELSLRDLAARLPQDVKAVERVSAKAEEASWYQPFPLNPIQFAYWIGRKGIIPLGQVSAHGYLEVKMTEIDIPRLQAALNQLIKQHHMLRVTVDKKGHQCVSEKVPEYQIPIIDVSTHPANLQDVTLHAVREELSHQVKDASKWPLFDIRISKIADNHYRLHLSFDSLIIDMYSMRLLFDEWYRLYTDSSYRITPLTFTFRDYQQAVEALKEEVRYKKAETYWLERVNTMPLGPDLPLLMEPAEVKKQKFARCSAVVPQDTWAAIKNKAKERNVSPTNVLLTVFSIVLGRYSRRKEFLVNLTLFRRNQVHPEVKKLLGDFTNVEVFQADVRQAHKIAFETLIHASKERLLEDLDHADYNGVDVQRALIKAHGLENNEAVAPIVFTSLLNLKLGRDSDQQKGDSVWQQFGEVEFSTTQTPQIWLDHKTFESSEGLVVEWDYVEALFGQEMMGKMHTDYTRYIEHLSYADWRQPLPDLVTQDLLPRLKGMNNTANAQFIQSETLPSLIGNASASNAQKVAVFDETGRLTYAEFNQHTDTVAAALQAAGIRKGDFVGVHIDRSVNMLVAIVAVLKAGGVYLPIEPALPAMRKRYVLQDSGAKVVLTDAANIDFGSDIPTKTMDISQALLRAVTFTPVEIKADDLAYLLYTSGTSGDPKGVMIEHRSVVNRILWMQQDYHICANDVFIQKTPISFDVSIWELFLPLISGASVFMPKPGGHKDISYLKGAMEQHHISRAHFVPSMLEIFLQARPVTSLPALQTLFCSGEALLPAQVNRFNACYPGAQIVNFYGPTEVAVDVTYWRAPKTPVTEVPIGQPAANVEIMILDSVGLPCPVGVPGELWLAGVQVARGYLNLAEKTAASFVENPYASTPQAKRAYRTGDLAYLNAEGQIIYQGRMDRQVKIRGQRIELDEVQQGISMLPMVRQAVVLPVKDESDKTTLVAFITQDAVPSKTQMDAKLAGAVFDKQERDNFTVHNESRLAEQRSGTTVALFGDDMPEAMFQRKSYRNYLGAGLTRQDLTAFLSAKEEVKPTQNFSLANWLKALAAYRREGLVFAKYPYPSAGSLYPVKCYLAVGDNDQNITPGYYYFDQVCHQLERLPCAKAPIASGIQVALVAHKRMIAPLYGRFWCDFAAIEAGSMLALLLQQSQSMNLCMTKTDAESFAASLAFVADEDVVCGSWVLEQNKPELTQGAPFPVWIAVNDTVDGLRPGLYCWDGRELHHKAESKYPLHLLNEGDNAQMLAQSSAVAFFTAPSELVERRLAIGVEMMNWMEKGISRQIGVCPMGSCPIPKNWADIIGEPVVLAATIGSVSQKQIQEQATSRVSGSPPEVTGFLREQLKNTALTEAMYPDRFLVVSEMPTTNNGKLDHRTLLAMAKKAGSSEPLSLVKPRTPLEKAIFEIWEEKEVLKGKVFGIHDTYQAAGGSSMTQNTLSLRLQETFQVEVSSADVYSHATIAKQAQLIDVKQDEELKINGSFALASMVIKGNVKMIERMLKSGKVDVNQQDARGRTALYIAAYHGRSEIVSLLRQYKAQIDIAKHSGTTPKACADRMGHQHLLEHLTPVSVTDDGVKTLFNGSDSQSGTYSPLPQTQKV